MDESSSSPKTSSEESLESHEDTLQTELESKGLPKPSSVVHSKHVCPITAELLKAKLPNELAMIAADYASDPVEMEEMATQFVKSGKNPEAVQLFTLAAKGGNIEAQRKLAEMHELGIGIPKNLQEAIRLYTLAANQGDAVAQLVLGNIYLYGKGIPKDEVEALRLFTQSSNQGNPGGEYALAHMHEHGLGGLPRNRAEVIRLLTSSANKGNPVARRSLDALLNAGN
jgi:TPR repeat protein